LTILLFFVLLPLKAQNSSFPNIEGDPKAREYSRRGADETCSWQDLAEIALWASGAEAAGQGGRRNRGSVRDIIAGAVADLGARENLPPGPRERGEYIMEFMHRRYLKTYSAYQTLLDEIFASGRYNCVSSAVLYTILASSVGLEVRGILTRDHAFVTINTGTELIDVETTNPYGFDPGNRREFHDEFSGATGFVYVPAKNYRDRVSISRLELVSLILTNRIAEYERQGRYGEAIPLAVNRAILLANRQDPVSSPFFHDPQEDLMDRLFNYGASLINGGREADALAWAAFAWPRYPGAGSGDDPRWPQFVYAALNNQVTKLLQSGRITEAREALIRNDRAGDARVSPKDRRALEILVTDAELTERIGRIKTAEDAEAVFTLIDQAGSTLSAARAEEFRTYVIINEGKRRAAAEGPLAGIVYIEEAIGRYGSNNVLENALRVFRQNQIVALHNRFADLFNRKDFEGARRVIQGALREFPGNRQLQSDLDRLEQALR
jgi:tetratricopeptide (TPR) repeat protein